eukprot:COSAG05_NODE_986_length_6286_cov_3.404881_6_plen_71_part_00
MRGYTAQSWEILKYQVESTPVAANVLMNSWSDEIGGFDSCGVTPMIAPSSFSIRLLPKLLLQFGLTCMYQ